MLLDPGPWSHLCAVGSEGSAGASGGQDSDTAWGHFPCLFRLQLPCCPAHDHIRPHPHIRGSDSSSTLGSLQTSDIKSRFPFFLFCCRLIFFRALPWRGAGSRSRVLLDPGHCHVSGFAVPTTQVPWGSLGKDTRRESMTTSAAQFRIRSFVLF